MAWCDKHEVRLYMGLRRPMTVMCPRCGGMQARPEIGISTLVYAPYWGTDGAEVYCPYCALDVLDISEPTMPGSLLPCRMHRGKVMVPTQAYIDTRIRVRAAAHAARTARFEHGESGPSL